MAHIFKLFRAVEVAVRRGVDVCPDVLYSLATGKPIGDFTAPAGVRPS